MVSSTRREKIASTPGQLCLIVAPLLLAITLFAVNNLAILSGWLNPPDGYVPALVPRGADFAQYLTWLSAFQDKAFISNYHAPWRTEPALFNPLLWALAQSCGFLGIGLMAGYHLLHFFFYVLAAYSLLFTLRSFTDTPGQMCAALAIILCSVPLQSLAIVPALALTNKGQLPGVGDFVWWSSDGFFHGVAGSLLVTAGTATALLAFGFLAKYLRTGRRHHFGFALLAVFFSALIHPFEVFVIAPTGAVTLVWRKDQPWKRGISEAALLGLAGLIGLLPYVHAALRHQWIREAAELNQWYLGSPLRVLVMLGLPTILALLFLLARPRVANSRDLLLRTWVLGVLIGIYLPRVPWSQHLLDGFHYAVGLLLVREASQSALWTWVRGTYPHLIKPAFSVWCVLSLLVYVGAYRQSYLDGRTATPARLFSAVAPRDESAVISWMRQYAETDQLVLAPPDISPWLATVPMHSFASHYIWSLTFQEQAQLSKDFFGGHLARNTARRFLSDYGVRYIVIPESSPGTGYLDESEKKDKVGSLIVYELSGNAMKPYPGFARKVSLVH